MVWMRYNWSRSESPANSGSPSMSSPCGFKNEQMGSNVSQSMQAEKVCVQTECMGRQNVWVDRACHSRLGGVKSMLVRAGFVWAPLENI